MTTLPDEICLFDGCSRYPSKRGYCETCYARMRRQGKLPVLVGKRAPRRNKKTLAERFWEKVSVNGQGACWPWVARAGTKGYGAMNVDGRNTRATHVSWYLHHGEWPNGLGLWVLHTCDNPACVNPAHLFLGTHNSNMRDMVRKGRAGRLPGEAHALAKLTEQEVRLIRRRAAAGEAKAALAREYGVSWMTVDRIIRRVNWAHIP